MSPNPGPELDQVIYCQFCNAEGELTEDGEYPEGWGDIELPWRGPRTACPNCLKDRT